MTDSVFVKELDGIFYELFPNVGFGSGDTFRRALDPDRFNNLFAARSWPRTTNGGPWLILSHRQLVGSYRDEGGSWQSIDPGNLLRAVALLTDATSTHYDYSASTYAGIPEVELNLGKAISGVEIVGERYIRNFERGRVVLELGVGYYPEPISFSIEQAGVVIESFGEMSSEP